MTKDELMPYTPASCGGEICSMCGEPAQRKVEEIIFDDDPIPYRHPLTVHVCFDHFNKIMDRSGFTHVEQGRLRMTTLSGADERLLNSKLKDEGMTVVHKHEFKTATAKKLAFHCYHKNILFHWSNENYYFRKVKQ